MRPDEASLRGRASRLLRWYPKEWRTRYGDEFVELLIADMAERPQSWRRGMDVALNGVVARSASAGLGGEPLDLEDGERRSLAAAGAALAIFGLFALAIWSQLTIGWQWAHPNTIATSWAMVVMSAAIVTLGALGIAWALPILWVLARTMARGVTAELLRPLLMVLGGLGILVIGTHHFANGWPGTGGHPWAHQGLVPGGVAAFAWASTLCVTSYWAHPTALSSFPAQEVAWMIVSPAAFVSLLVGAAKLVRRLGVSPRLLRHERRLAFLATVAMAIFLTGAALWVFDGGPGPRNLFHIGAIDMVELAAMALALAMTSQAVRRVGLARTRLAAR